MLYVIIFVIVLYVIIRKVGKPSSKEEVFKRDINKQMAHSNQVKNMLDEREIIRKMDEQRKAEYQEYRNNYQKPTTVHPGNGSSPDYLSYVLNFITAKLGTQWSFRTPNARHRILFNEFSHAEKFKIYCHSNCKEYELSFIDNKLELKPVQKIAIINDTAMGKDSAPNSRLTNTQKTSQCAVENRSITMKADTSKTESERKAKLEESDLKKIAKDWLKNNMEYMNTVIGQCDSDSSVVFEKSKLPKNKQAWEYIGKSLTDDDEFSSYKVNEDLILYF